MENYNERINSILNYFKKDFHNQVERINKCIQSGDNDELVLRIQVLKTLCKTTLKQLDRLDNDLEKELKQNAFIDEILEKISAFQPLKVANENIVIPEGDPKFLGTSNKN